MRKAKMIITSILLVLLVTILPLERVDAVTKTFDFEASTSGSTNPGDPSGTNKTVTQSVTGHTLVITQDQGNLLCMDAVSYNGSSRTHITGNAVFVDGSYATTQKLTLTVSGSYTFDLNSINLLDQNGTGLTLKFTTTKGSATRTLTGDNQGEVIDLSAESVLKGVAYVEITENTNGVFILELDDIVLDNITAPITPLAQVGGLSLNTSGVASWTDVAHESSYSVQLFKDGTPQGSAVSVAADTLSTDFFSTMRSAGAGVYTFKVTAIGDGVSYSTGAQSNASGSQTLSTLATVSAGMTWTSDTAHWTSVANAVSYDVQLYKNNIAIGSAVNVTTANVSSGVDFSSAISTNGYGIYTYKVSAKADANSLYLDASQSTASNDNTKLAKVTGLNLLSTGVINWSDVDNEASYDVQLFKDGNTQGAVVNKAINSTTHDFLSAIKTAGAGVYTVKVTAKGNGTTSYDGLISDVSNSQTAIQLSTVSAGLNWAGEVAKWTSVSNAVSYDVQLYKDNIITGTAINVLAANVASGADFSTLINANGGGNYTYKVTALGDNYLVLDAPASSSSDGHFVATPLVKVTNVQLSALGVASWDDISNESSYDVQLFKDGNAQGTAVSKGSNVLSHDFLSLMRTSGAGVYSVKVTAKGDLVNYSDAPISDASSTRTIASLSTVSAGLSWSGDVAKWTSVGNALSYNVQLYKDAVSTGSPVNVLAADVSTGADFASAIALNGVGNYTYKVTAISDPSSLYLDAVASGASNNNTKLEKVSGVALSSVGVASWTDAANETGYSIQLFKNGLAEGSAVTKAANATSHDFLSVMRASGVGVYTVKVTATGDSVTSFDGAVSDASASQTVALLATVNAGLNWTGDVAHWTAVSNANSYDVQLYKDNILTGSAINVLAVNAGSGADFSTLISANGGGNYTFKVTAKASTASLYFDALESLASSNHFVATPLLQVTGVSLDALGVVTWNDVANESSYDVQLYKDSNILGSAISKTADTTSHDFLSAMRSAGVGSYTVKVVAKGDTVNFSDSQPSVASGAQNISNLATVTAGLTWTGNVAHWTAVANAESYDVQLYKNGSVLGTAVNILSADSATGADFSTAVTGNGGGVYTYKVTAKASATSLYLNGVASGASNDNIVAIQLAQVTGVALSNTGVASWTNISNESSYSLQLYKDLNVQGSAVTVLADVTSYDFLSAMRSAGVGSYTVKVTAIGNGTTYSDAIQSVASSAQTVSQLSTVGAGTWVGQKANWNAVANAVSYNVQLLKSGNPVGSVSNVLAADVSGGLNFGSLIVANGVGTYSFTVTAVGDSKLLLDATVSNNSTDNVISSLDAIAPTTGGAGVITDSNLSSTGITLSWSAGSDDSTLTQDLEYKVVSSLSNNLTTALDAETNGTVVKNWSNALTANITGLTANTMYYFNVIVRDAFGNTAVYVTTNKQTLLSSHLVSFVSNGGSSVSSQTITSGQKAIKPANPTRSGYSFVNWYTDIALTSLYDFNANVLTPLTLYAKWSVVSSGSSDSGSSGNQPTPPPTNVVNTAVIINGEIFNIGKESSTTTTDGKSQTVVSVDKQSVLKQINSESGNQANVIQVNVNAANADKAVVSLTGDIIKSLEDKNFDLAVKKDGVEYKIPAKEFTINTVANNLNVAQTDLQKIAIDVSITKPDDATQKRIDAQFKTNNNVIPVVSAVDFTLNATVTDSSGVAKNVTVDHFSQYVERSIPLPTLAGPNRITTGVVFNSDGTFEHVPTTVLNSGQSWMAKIYSRTNSTYSVIYSPVEVKSVENHWSKEAVNDMASRLIINQVNTFKPDEAISRAEFVDYIVRGLGLYRKDTAILDQFKDVGSQLPYAISIAIAKENGLIKGYDNGMFKPNAQITREEAMVILSKAISYVNVNPEKAYNDNQFKDFKDVSVWAKDAVLVSVNSKVFNGKLSDSLKPKDTFTKAEAATVIRNLLIIAKLINE